MPTAAANQGGPVGCGYQWTDTYEPPPKVEFNWTEINETGTEIPSLVGEDDDYAGPFPLGFDFSFYGITYSELYVGTNGYVSFGQGYWEYWFDEIPSASPPNNVIYGFAADLFGGGSVYYEQLDSPKRFVVEFEDWPHLYGGDYVTFEIIIYETGEIWIQYLDVAGYVSVVGVENADGSLGTAYSTADVADGVAIRFDQITTPSGPVAVDVSPCHQLVRTLPGVSANVSLTVTNMGTLGNDTFDLTQSSSIGRTGTFYHADGVTPLSDTNNNSIPDTGPLEPNGGFLDVILRIDVPWNTTERNLLTINATSTTDPTVSDEADAIVEILPAAFRPPHSDYGLDTDGDGQYDYLVVEVNLVVVASDYYFIDTFLHDASYNLSLYDSTWEYFAAGNVSVLFEFSGVTINASGADGPYYVDLSLFDAWSYLLLDTGLHMTAAYSHLDFETPPAYLTPPHSDYGLDTDGDGQYDYLVVNANVTVVAWGTYYIGASLYDSSSTLSLYSSATVTLEPGFYNIPLSFQGFIINASGVDGPYYVDLSLYDAYTWAYLGDNIHTTAAYSHLQFETPPAEIAPPYSDQGVDFDGDGLFEFLVVNATLSVHEAGYYAVYAYLHDPNYSLIVFTSRITYLEEGTQTLQLWFDGITIYWSNVNGPYLVDFDLYDQNWTYLDSDTYTTGAYDHGAFESWTPNGYFAPLHTDRGVDTDGDGLFDYLVVTAAVASRYQQPYYVDAYLHNENGTLSVWTSAYVYLGPGINFVDLYLEGRYINASGVDGPYAVELNLYDGYWGYWLDSDSYETTPYSHLDFDGPPARFQGPHSDYGRDDDGDGLFDALVLEAGVESEYEGWFHIFAYLDWGGWNYSLWTWNDVYLEAGLNTVSFEFEGWRINGLPRDGPYTVNMSLFDSGWVWLDTDSYQTAAYARSDFEGPPRIASTFTTTRPAIDGVLSAGEWADATVVDLSSVPGNSLPAYLLVKDDSQYLYIAYDAIGDRTQDPYDMASISFDTGNDGIATEGREDQFVEGGWFGRGHLVYSSSIGGWAIEDAPYDPNLPNHEGLASARGWARSPNSGFYHRIYEFRIPFALIGVRPGDTIGFLAGSWVGPGVYDWSNGQSSIWPPSTYPQTLGWYGDLEVSPDVYPPDLAITAPADGSLLKANSVEVRWTASDIGLGIDRFELSVDGGPSIVLGPTETRYVLTSLPDGPHTITIVAYDLAGNERTASVNVVVDTTAPMVTVTSPETGTILATNDVTVSWSASDATSGIDHFDVSLDSGSPIRLGASASSYTFVDLTEGSHRVTVVAYDVAGFSQISSTTFTVDTVAPSLAISSPVSGAVLAARTVSVSWTALDTGTGIAQIEVSLDGSTTLLPGSATSHTFTNVTDGPHSIAVRAIDAAGNARSAGVTVLVDATAPTLTVTAPIDGSYLGSREVLVTWIAGDETSGLDHIEISLDGNPAIRLPASSAAFTFSALSEGTHRVTVRAVDVAGNAGTATTAFTVDVTPPVVEITYPAASAILTESSLVLTWSASDPASGIERIEVILDGGTPISLTATATSYRFEAIPDGSHSIKVVAYDASGHSSSASVDVTVDTTAPSLEITSPGAGATLTSPTVQVTWTASDATTGLRRFAISLDGSAPVEVSGETFVYVFAGLRDGTHTVTLTAYDRAGNIETASVVFTVDTGLFSPSGPYGAAPLTGLAIGVVAALAAAVLLFRRRRSKEPPKEGT